MRDEISVEVLDSALMSAHSKHWKVLAISKRDDVAADAELFQVLESMTSFLLNNVPAVRVDGLDLVEAADYSEAKFVESCLACESGYLMNIVELVVVVVVADRDKKT